MTRLTAILLAAGLLAGVARAAERGFVSASVVPNPLVVSLTLDVSDLAVGQGSIATATVRNLGTGTVSGVTVTLHVDPTGLALRGGPTQTLSIAGGGSLTPGWSVCGISPGSYVLIASASTGSFTAESDAQVLEVDQGSGSCAEDAAGVVGAGNTLTTDAEADGAHPADPVETSVTTPGGGFVEIVEQPGGTAPAGLTVLGWQVFITAQPATAASPLRVVIELDSSLLPPGVDPLAVEIFRNGVPLPPCVGPAAAPDPCRSGHALQPDGDLVLMALTSAASTWTFGTTYRFTGFFSPVDNPPTVNTVRAGRAVPVKFSLGGGHGVSVLAAGYPKSQRVACGSGAPVDEVEETVSAGGDSLTYDPASDRYTYVWKTQGGWAGTCRQLIVRLADGTDRLASFKLR